MKINKIETIENILAVCLLFLRKTGSKQAAITGRRNNYIPLFPKDALSSSSSSSKIK